MNLGFREKRRPGGFCSGETRGQPSDGDGRSRATGPAPQPRRDRAQGRNPGPGPGCGLGAGERARTAGRGAALSARMGRGCWAGFAGARARVSRPWAAHVLAGPKWSNEQILSQFCFSYFPENSLINLN